MRAQGRDRSREGLLGHYGVELVRTDLPIGVSVSTFDHFQQLRIGHGLAELLRYSLQIS